MTNPSAKGTKMTFAPSSKAEGSSGNRGISFASEPGDDARVARLAPWKIIIVDDEKEVHTVTKMVLADYEFEHRTLEFYSGYSGQEGKKLMEEHPDAALLFLDVVMETDHSGLEVVKYVRDELHNSQTRVILRTGQPGHAPEKEVVAKYDINDYRSKTELTAMKMFTAVTAALRAYRDIRTADQSRKGLELIVKASAALLDTRSFGVFAQGVLSQLTALLHLNNDAAYFRFDAFAASGGKNGLEIVAATGKFEGEVGHEIHGAISEAAVKDVEAALEVGETVVHDGSYVGLFKGNGDFTYIVYLGDYDHLSDIDRKLVQVFTTNVGVAYDNLILNQEIVETQKEIVITLGEVVESRSQETANHVRRVGEYSYLLGKLAGLSENESEILHLASPMHDVGKIGIPEAIINKPGKLTKEEFDIVKTHTTIGYEILKGSSRDILKSAAMIARDHHEKWNGMGYPKGLEGDDIHIFGRITGLVDVFDALSIKRVYKDAWPLEKVLNLIREERGEHFDPRLVDLFLENVKLFEAISKEFPDV